ncbi:hypothetical protein B0H16DRAFT_1473362 [Mycena metata]|uniref:Uncharacterized protein n=1 Tax=Mycena metata TaxID=1033252 RepID=A0AAD7MLN2_9AGAR|nr:hypothetical protein B0H16DRAFT_1473362 [Mycena metata]
MRNMQKWGGSQNLGLIGPKWKSQWKVEELAKGKSAAELGHPDLGGLSKRKTLGNSSGFPKKTVLPKFWHWIALFKGSLLPRSSVAHPSRRLDYHLLLRKLGGITSDFGGPTRRLSWWTQFMVLSSTAGVRRLDLSCFLGINHESHACNDIEFEPKLLPQAQPSIETRLNRVLVHQVKTLDITTDCSHAIQLSLCQAPGGGRGASTTWYRPEAYMHAYFLLSECRSFSQK